MFKVCDLKPVGYSPWKPSPLRAATTNAYFVTRLHEARRALTESTEPTVAVAREYVDLLLVMVREWSMNRSSIVGDDDDDGHEHEHEPILEFCWSEDGVVIKTSCVRAELVMAVQMLTQLLLRPATDPETTPKDWELAVRLQLWVVRPQLMAAAYMPAEAASCGMMAHKTLMAMGILRLQVAVIHQWESKGLAGNTVARLLCWAAGTAKRLERLRPQDAGMKAMAAELEALLWFHTAKAAAKGAQKEKLLSEARDAFLLLRHAERAAQCERLMDEIAPRSDESPARIVQACVTPKCVVLDHAPLGDMYLPPEEMVRLWKSV